MPRPANPAAIVSELRARAEALGFEAFGIAPAELPAATGKHLAEALERGWHGDMAWMSETAERRKSPRAMWPGARSAIVVGLNYGPAENPLKLLERTSHGAISAYARGRDYHDIVKGRLKELAGLLARRTGAEVKVFVDTAPLMEKPLAQAAGLGWQGKHTVLVSRRHGSWLFLGVILTSAELPADAPHAEGCGSCRRCLDICPTNALPAPFQLDARRCLAYWTVEAKGQIPVEFRVPMGNRVFGCDDCLAVCPWNKFATATREMKLAAGPERAAPPLAELVALDEAGFRKMFAGSPVKRLGHTRFLRNVLITIGNSGDIALLPAVEARLADPAPLIRGAAVWALRRLARPERIAALAASRLPREADPEVAAEWRGEVAPARAAA